MIKYTAPELIAFHFSADISEVKDMVYQPTVYRSPRVYVWGEDYYCCPTDRQKLPSQGDTFNWKPFATHHGRTIYESLASWDSSAQ